jgi:hypothetical protein
MAAGDGISLRSKISVVTSDRKLETNEALELQKARGERQTPAELVQLETLRASIVDQFDPQPHQWLEAQPEAVRVLDAMISSGADRRVSDYLALPYQWLEQHSILDTTGTVATAPTWEKALSIAGSVVTVPLAFGSLIALGPPTVVAEGIEEVVVGPREPSPK